MAESNAPATIPELAGIVYRIPLKTYNLLRNKFYTHEEVLSYLNESTNLRGSITKLEVF